MLFLPFRTVNMFFTPDKFLRDAFAFVELDLLAQVLRLFLRLPRAGRTQ